MPRKTPTEGGITHDFCKNRRVQFCRTCSRNYEPLISPNISFFADSQITSRIRVSIAFLLLGCILSKIALKRFAASFVFGVSLTRSLTVPRSLDLSVSFISNSFNRLFNAAIRDFVQGYGDPQLPQYSGDVIGRETTLKLAFEWYSPGISLPQSLHFVIVFFPHC